MRPRYRERASTALHQIFAAPRARCENLHQIFAPRGLRWIWTRGSLASGAMSSPRFARAGLLALACAAAAAACGGGDDRPAARPLTCSVTAPTSCPDPAPRYADIAPIVSRRCVACHWGAIDGPWPLLTYTSIVDWEDLVRGSLLDCSMPPLDSGVVMADEERVAILTWLRCGHPR
jgi:hypothetical protein